jgi:hypothetical protein
VVAWIQESDRGDYHSRAAIRVAGPVRRRIVSAEMTSLRYAIEGRQFERGAA